MADKASQFRNLIYQHASKRRSLKIGPTGRLNHSAIARLMGVEPSTVNRVMNLDPSRRPESDEKDWSPSQKFIDGLKSWLGFVLDSEVYQAAEEAPQAPPPSPTARKRKRR